MPRLSSVVLFLVALIVGAAMPACKPQAEAKKESKSKDVVKKSSAPTSGSTSGSGSANDDDDNSGDQSDSDCSKSKSSKSDDDDDDDDDSTSLRGTNPVKAHKTSKKPKRATAAFSLADDVTYEDVESIISSKCVTCHSSGGTSPDISTYSKAKAKASSIQSSIISGKMPPSGSSKLTSSEKTKIKDWVAGGKLEKPTSTSTSTSDSDDDDDDDETTSTSSDCDDSESSDDEETSTLDKEKAYEELLNSPKFKECKDDKKVYDRGKDQCHSSTIATSFECTVEGIVKKFKSYGITLKTSSGKIAGFEDYEIDQCGEYKSEPAIFFYKRVDGDTESEIKLSTKLLCKKNSPACDR